MQWADQLGAHSSLGQVIYPRASLAASAKREMQPTGKESRDWRAQLQSIQNLKGGGSIS